MQTRLFTLSLVAILPCFASAQSPVAPPHVIFSSEIDSGYIDNAGQTRLVFKRSFKFQDTAWMQLRFGETSNLPTGSFLRLTGTKEKVSQRLDGVSLAEWNMHSALFNGGEIVLELFAGTNTKGSRIKVLTVVRGLPKAPPIIESICGSTDDRVLSLDKRQGRLWLGCTGWLAGIIAGGTRNLMLTAGHCTGSTNILELNVPASTSGGSVVRSHPNDQYPYTILDRISGGVGADWQVASVGRNSNTSKLPTQANGGVFYNLGTVPSSTSGQRITITGYGVTSPRATKSQVQQTHTGNLSRIAATSLCYATDTTGGNSGSPIIHANTGNAIGIHTHGGCSSSGGCNSGTRIDRSDLQAAISKAGKKLGSFVTFGQGCKGSGSGGSFCVSLNPNGGTLSNTTAPNEYAYTATATSNLSVVGFEIFSQSTTGGNVTVNTRIYGRSGTGPGALLGSGTMTIGGTAGFYKTNITASVPAGLFFISADHSATTTRLANLTSGAAGAGFWRRPPGSGTWSASGLLPRPSYRVLCSGGGGRAAPVIGNTGVPTINASFTVRISVGKASAPAVLLSGVSNTTWSGGSLPFGLGVIGAPGCNLLVDPRWPAGILLNGSGAGAIPISIPNQASLVGAKAYHQWYVIDAGNNAANIAVSNGATSTIGG